MAFFVCLLSSLAFQMLKKKQIVTFWFIKASIYFYLFSSYSIRLGTCVLNRFQVSQNNAVQDILTKLEVIIHRLEVLLSSETLTITKQNCAKKNPRHFTSSKTAAVSILLRIESTIFSMAMLKYFV